MAEVSAKPCCPPVRAAARRRQRRRRAVLSVGLALAMTAAGAARQARRPGRPVRQLRRRPLLPVLVRRGDGRQQPERPAGAAGPEGGALAVPAGRSRTRRPCPKGQVVVGETGVSNNETTTVCTPTGALFAAGLDRHPGVPLARFFRAVWAAGGTMALRERAAAGSRSRHSTRVLPVAITGKHRGRLGGQATGSDRLRFDSTREKD